MFVLQDRLGREDLSLIDGHGTMVAYVEVKGVSTGVKREHVKQSDSHKERNGQSTDFPTLLIINTFIKNAGSLEEKNRPVEAEQVEHAARNNVLILRTLDLLNLASLLMAKKLTENEVVVHLTHMGGGWLEVGNIISLHRTYASKVLNPSSRR